MNKFLSFATLKTALVQRTRFELIHEPQQGEFTYLLIHLLAQTVGNATLFPTLRITLSL